MRKKIMLGIVLLFVAGCPRTEPGRSCSREEMVGPFTVEAGEWGYEKFNRDCQISPEYIPGLIGAIETKLSPRKLDWVQVHYETYSVGGNATSREYYGLGFWFHVAK